MEKLPVLSPRAALGRPIAPTQLSGLTAALPGALTAALAAALVLAACSSSNGTEPIPPLDDLELGSLRVLTDHAEVGHCLELETELTSERDVQNVAVSYYLMSVADEHDGEPEQYLIGSAVYPLVTAGSATYTTTLVVPGTVADVDEEEFYIFAAIDPLDAVPETESHDNYPLDEPTRIVLDDDHRYEPDLSISQVELDQTAVVLVDHDAQEDTAPEEASELEDKEDHHFGATVEIRADGVATQHDIDLTAYIRVAGSPPLELPLLIWDADAPSEDGEGTGEYVEHYMVDELEPGSTYHCYVDLLIPSTPLPGSDGANSLEQLEALLADHSSYEIVFELDRDLPHAAQYEDPDASSPNYDNDTCSSQVLLLPDDTPPGPPASGAALRAEEHFKKEWSSDHFGIGIEFDAIARLDGRGAYGEAGTRLPTHLLGIRFDALALDAAAQYVPHQPEDSSFELNLEVAGVLIYTASGNLEEEDNSYASGGLAQGYHWDYPFDHHFLKEASTTFTIGPVPINVGGEVEGGIGFHSSVSLASGTTPFALVVDPHARIEARAHATASLLVAHAEVEGRLVLLDEKFRLSVDSEISHESGEIDGSLTAHAENELHGADGTISAYVEFPKIKWCKRWGVPYPCGTEGHRTSRGLVQWDGYRKDDVLLHYEKTLAVPLPVIVH